LIFDLAQATGGRSDPACTAARAAATPVAQAAIDDTLAANDLDAIIAPTNGPAWVTDPVNGDLGGDFSTFVGSSAPAAIAGYADITVPAGYVGPLPLGITFIGGRWDEPTLIGLAYAFEQATASLPRHVRRCRTGRRPGAIWRGRRYDSHTTGTREGWLAARLELLKAEKERPPSAVISTSTSMSRSPRINSATGSNTTTSARRLSPRHPRARRRTEPPKALR
jgi:hypothetical protein